jgi:hypothetical protein
MKKIILVLLAMVSLVVVSGCYRPNWYRANTTLAELKTDSEWCKSQTNIGSTRAEMIDQYEKCMKDKGYQPKGKGQYSGEPTIRVEKDTGPIVIDKRSKVYVGIGGGGVTYSPYLGGQPVYRYFHKKDCKQLWNISTEEVTVGEAIARGKSMCPYCFRN